MKRESIYLNFFILLLILVQVNSIAQTPNFKTAISYLNYIGQQQEKITKDYWDYASSIAHSTSARKVENRRLDLVKTTQNAITKISQMPDFDGDKSLRDSMLSYLRMSYNVLVEDYAKLVDLEEIAEQSYDAMEAYMLAKEKASEKLEQAGEMVDEVVKNFASNNKITIVDNEDKTSKKLTKAGVVFRYYNPIYLIFFKNYKQELYLIDAISKNDFVAIEQNRNKLAEISKNDLKSIDTLKSFKGDNSLTKSLKQLLSFYNDEANKVTIITDFYLKKEKFDKIKAAIDSKREAERTKEDIDQYNQAVKEFNKLVGEFNKTNKELNDNRYRLINDWNSNVSSFFDRYVPKK